MTLTDNDYRRIGLVLNPLKYGTEELADAITLSATNAVIFSPDFCGSFNSRRNYYTDSYYWWSASDC